MLRRYPRLAPEHPAPHAVAIDGMLNVTSTAQLSLVSNSLWAGQFGKSMRHGDRC